MERLKVLLADEGVSSQLFESVVAVKPRTLPDLDARIQAVSSFLELPEAEALAAANKRIRNILRKSNDEILPQVDAQLLQDQTEKTLFEVLQAKQQEISPFLNNGDYRAALGALAELRTPVDKFFDDVMVNVDDAALRRNRLALLQALANLFLQVADISRLQQ